MCSTRSFDDINNSVVKFERGELVRGSDPPLAYKVHTTAGSLRPGPTMILFEDTFGDCCVENKDKHSPSSPKRRKVLF